VSLLLSLWFALATARAAAPGAPGLAKAEPAAPAKPVEEPVFQLPELVIVGENQARILAQKEQFTSSPLKGLREAPLLEKEENTVAALRLRAPVAPSGTEREGVVGAARVEGGAPLWGGGALWLGRVTPRSALALEAEGSALRGDGKAGGVAGGRDVAVGFSAARPGRDSASLGWRERVRDLPAQSPSAHRQYDRLRAAGEAAGGGAAALAGLTLARLTTPQGGLSAAALAASGEWPAWTGAATAVTIRPRAEAELADAAGRHASAGADAEAAWIPDERVRAFAGVAADGAFGGGLNAASARPLAGASWTVPAGWTFEASFRPGFRVPWLAASAEAAPYSWFTAAPAPERDRADATVAAWLRHVDGSGFRAAYRYRDAVDALSWRERPGQGLWEPATLASFRMHELRVSGELRQLAPFVVTAAGAWRQVATSGGRMANLPRSEGALGGTWTRGNFTAGTDVRINGLRPRGAASVANDLPASADWSAGVAWRPAARWELYARAANLLGDPVQTWGGYADPARLVTLGARLAF